jgi:hypothetical protein
MVDFRDSTQEKSPSEIFRFGYGRASSDKMVPDRVSSKVQRLVCDWRRAGIFYNHSKEGARNAASMLDNVVDR